MSTGGSSNGLVDGLKAAGDASLPVYGMLTRLDSSGKIVPSGMVGGAPNPGYTNAPLRQGPVYQPQYQQYQPQQRAPQYQQQTPNYMSGLQAAMANMMQQYSRPMMRAPMQQGIAQSSPLAYRPPAVDNLSKVAPSVELQQRLAAEAEAKRLAEEAANAPPPTYDYGGA
jgi:hypothetical protein